MTLISGQRNASIDAEHAFLLWECNAWEWEEMAMGWVHTEDCEYESDVENREVLNG